MLRVEDEGVKDMPTDRSLCHGSAALEASPYYYSVPFTDTSVKPLPFVKMFLVERASIALEFALHPRLALARSVIHVCRYGGRNISYVTRPNARTDECENGRQKTSAHDLFVSDAGQADAKPMRCSDR
ncbi:hypothetical protein DTW90_20370 [Neorhizobium sp. P12A]|nr:hypothetical protein DTW90_20370 [Neorhizobium sp. P12A]